MTNKNLHNFLRFGFNLPKTLFKILRKHQQQLSNTCATKAKKMKESESGGGSSSSGTMAGCLFTNTFRQKKPEVNKLSKSTAKVKKEQQRKRTKPRNLPTSESKRNLFAPKEKWACHECWRARKRTNKMAIKISRKCYCDYSFFQTQSPPYKKKNNRKTQNQNKIDFLLRGGGNENAYSFCYCTDERTAPQFNISQNAAVLFSCCCWRKKLSLKY